MAFEKAMTEHRTPDYRQSLSEVTLKLPSLCLNKKNIQVESELKKAEELAYINPELAEQEKLKGNDWLVFPFVFCPRSFDGRLIFTLPNLATLDVVSASRKENGQTLSSFTQKLSRGILRLIL